MSSKIDIPEVIETLKRLTKLDPKTLIAIETDLEAKETESDDKEPTPRVKTQHVIILADKEGKLPKADLVGWIVAIPESDSPSTALSRVQTAAHDFNASKKGRLLPCKTLGETLESASRKFLKNQGVKVVTKIPVLAMASDNSIGQPPTA